MTIYWSRYRHFLKKLSTKNNHCRQRSFRKKRISFLMRTMFWVLCSWITSGRSWTSLIGSRVLEVSSKCSYLSWWSSSEGILLISRTFRWSSLSRELRTRPIKPPKENLVTIKILLIGGSVRSSLLHNRSHGVLGVAVQFVRRCHCMYWPAASWGICSAVDVGSRRRARRKSRKSKKTMLS